MNPSPLSFASLCLCATATAQTVFSTDFDTAMPAAIAPGTATLTGVQGCSGYGPAGNTFGGDFLRSETGNVVTLSLTGLPTHTVLHLDFLFAAIDSLDGTGSYPSGDYFKITLDGTTVFREAFANALPSQIQTYVPPPGVELARHVDLGFTGPGSYYTDSAYYLGADPFFASLPHTGATATITFVIEGQGIQALNDESWAIDNLRVHCGSSTLGSTAAYGTGCGPSLAGTSIPAVGQSLGLQMDNLPANTVLALGAFGLSSSTIGSLVLPLPLDSYGMPGCWLVQDLSLMTWLPFTINGTSATSSLAIPGNSAFVGLQMFSQGWAVKIGINPTGIVFSNGLRIRVGT